MQTIQHFTNLLTAKTEISLTTLVVSSNESKHSVDIVQQRLLQSYVHYMSYQIPVLKKKRYELLLVQ